MTCFGRGYPLPKVIWNIDNQNTVNSANETKRLVDVLVEGKDYVFESDAAILHLLNLTHIGKRIFTCKVINDAGSDKISYSIITISNFLITLKKILNKFKSIKQLRFKIKIKIK